MIDPDVAGRGPLIAMTLGLASFAYEQIRHAARRCVFNGELGRAVLAPTVRRVGGGAAALLGVEFARQILCGDDSLMSGAGFLPNLGKGLRRGPLRYRGQPSENEGVIEHAQPVKPVPAALPSDVRSHIFHGEVDTKEG